MSSNALESNKQCQVESESHFQGSARKPASPSGAAASAPTVSTRTSSSSCPTGSATSPCLPRPTHRAFAKVAKDDLHLQQQPLLKSVALLSFFAPTPRLPTGSPSRPVSQTRPPPTTTLRPVRPLPLLLRLERHLLGIERLAPCF